METISKKVSELTSKDVADFIHLEEDEYEPNELNMILEAAIEYVADFTGIPKDELDNYKKFNLAVLVLCQDMHDNRSYYVDKSNVNKVVESILYMHKRNYL